MWFGRKNKKATKAEEQDAHSLRDKVTSWWRRWYYIVWTIAGVIVAMSSVVTILVYFNRPGADKEQNPYRIENLMKDDAVIEDRVTKLIWNDMKDLYAKADSADSKEMKSVLDGIAYINPEIFPRLSWKTYFKDLKQLLNNCVSGSDVSRRFKFLWKWQRPPWGGVEPTCWQATPIKIYVKISDGLMSPSGWADPQPGVAFVYSNSKQDEEKAVKFSWAEMKRGVLFPMKKVSAFWIDEDTKEITIDIWDYNWSNEKKGSITVDIVKKPNGKISTGKYIIEWEFNIE